jgi:hypothetical protein
MGNARERTGNSTEPGGVIMGESAARQPGDAQVSEEAGDDTSAETEQETQAQDDQPPAGDPRKDPGPQSKFHG